VARAVHMGARMTTNIVPLAAIVGALAAGCALSSNSSPEDTRGGESTATNEAAWSPSGLDVPRMQWTRVGYPWAARKIAACTDGRLFALNADRSLWLSTTGGTDGSWKPLPALHATQQISCANNQLVAFNDDRSLYQNIGTDASPAWKWLGRPWAAGQVGAGTELDVFFPSARYFALNDDKSFWSSTDGGGWSNLGSIGSTDRIAGAGGYLTTRVYALNNDKSFWVNTGEGRSGYWHRLPMWGLSTPLLEITARSEASVYALDTSYNLWQGTTVKLDELDRLDMPSSDFVPTRAVGYDYPNDSSMSWTYILQGVTHDNDNWYITGQYGITSIPVDHDLNDHSATYTSAPIPDALWARGYNHLGQPAYANGYVYVPLEGAGPPMVVAYDTNLNVISWTTLDPHGVTNESPWVGINPVDGYLYTSNFETSPTNPLRAYKITWLANTSEPGKRILELDLVDSLVLRNESGTPITIGAIGGGAFTKNGHLYLSSDRDGKVYGFDPTGTRKKTIGVDYSGFGSSQELEGLTVWDLDDGRAPNVRGELHLVMSTRDGFSLHFDSIFFKHYELTDPRDKTKL
jgi:hypothetical protein